MALVPLFAALALTGSRAAGGALVVGVATAAALTEARGPTIVRWTATLVVPATAFVALSASDLTNSAVVGHHADELGNRMLALVVGLTALAVLPALVSCRATAIATPAPGRRVRVLLVVTALGTLTAALVLGAPSLAGDRASYWRVATGEFREQPLLGSGAGTFSRVWLERRPIDASTRDAHSIVLEALSELGIPGLVLVVLLLLAPLAWGLRARGQPLAAAGAGAYAAFAVHACVDWDWELPAVTLAALFCAASLGALADRPRRVTILGPTARGAVAVLGVATALTALAIFVGASAMEDASRSLARGDLPAAERAASQAARWQPWSAEPLLMQGQAALGGGRVRDAEEDFVLGARRDPGDYRVWLGLASTADSELARAALLRARALNPRGVRSLSGS